MKPILLMLLLASPAVALDERAILHAISLVETGGNANAIGKRKEKGMYQMIPAIVSEFKGSDTAAATRAIREIERRFIAAGIEPTPFLVACAWNGGCNAVVEGRIRPAAWQYAIRVQNLMEKYHAKEK